MPIRCLLIEDGELKGLPPDTPLETLPGEEIMACDYDAIRRGRFNFKLYGQISKFFELIVVSFPARVEDLMDSLIAGAFRVVVDPQADPNVIARMLEVSDGVVMPASSLNRDFFMERGGHYLISDREVFIGFDLCYNVGHELSSKKYVNVAGFPEDLLRYI